MIQLSKRLQTIADRVTQGYRLADIGSDHALLPVYLVQSGKCPSAVAGELNDGPFQAARRQTAEAGLAARISVRQGDGLAVLSPGEADTVVIAGMGGSLMATILETGFLAGRLKGAKELVLQPNVGEDLVRKWLVLRGFALLDETILEEDGRFYEVLHAAPLPDAAERNGHLYDPAFLDVQMPHAAAAGWLYRMGPCLLRSAEQHETLTDKWRQELLKLERICSGLAQSDTEEARSRLASFRAEINQIGEVLACLPMVKRSSR
ncbi:tRNA (adenine(22)-N(1))-methyltransferase [Paenibacillus humicola]|uniref:tRNA (adenine(22)-N(1))-methyltransferase n=1 Tax=Paenibacillus humicola TaxID=3110540 RepID=UPI00237A89FD|nr:class I SAM-dependent methyltransferase [Paenibacillus humicola]